MYIISNRFNLNSKWCTPRCVCRFGLSLKYMLSLNLNDTLSPRNCPLRHKCIKLWIRATNHGTVPILYYAITFIYFLQNVGVTWKKESMSATFVHCTSVLTVLTYVIIL